MRKLLDFVQRVVQRRNQAPTLNAYTGSGLDWMMYGEDNLYPQQLVKLLNSPTHLSIVNTKTDMAYGAGPRFADVDVASGASQAFISACGGDPDPMLRALIRDIIIYGGCAIHITMGATLDSIVALERADFKTIRLQDPSKLADLTPKYAYQSPDWSQYSLSKLKPKPYPLWASGIIEAQSICYYAGQSDITDYYPSPDYLGAINWALTEIEIGNYHRNNVSNMFRPDVMISMPDTVAEDERLAFVKELSENYQGTDRAGGVLVLWAPIDRATGTLLTPQITPMPTTSNADLYLVTLQQCQQSIITAHRLPSPTLAGLAGQGGLGGNASEIATSFDYFYNTVCRGYVRRLADALWPLLRAMGFMQPIDFASSLPFTFTTQQPAP